MKPTATKIAALCTATLICFTASCASPDTAKKAESGTNVTSSAAAATAGQTTSSSIPAVRSAPATTAITGTNTGETTPPQQQPTTATSPAGKPVKEFTLVFRKGAKVKPTKWEVSKGDRVVITIDSDKADEFHLHGYDLKVKTNPGTPEKIEFDALIRGTFELESHHPAVVLGRLTVK